MLTDILYLCSRMSLALNSFDYIDRIQQTFNHHYRSSNSTMPYKYRTMLRGVRAIWDKPRRCYLTSMSQQPAKDFSLDENGLLVANQRSI